MQEEVALTVRSTKNQLAYLRALIEPGAPGPAREVLDLIEEAEGYLGAIERDGSRGFHNQTYAGELIERAKEKLGQARKLLGVSPASLEKQAMMRSP